MVLLLLLWWWWWWWWWEQRALEQYAGMLEKAKASFQKKFLDKSGNEWPLMGPFERVEGKYVLVGESY